MKKIKTLLMASTMILSMLSLSACGKEEPAPVTTPAPIQVSKEELGRVSESTTSAAPEESVEPVTETTAPIEEVVVGDKKLVPDCPVTHPDADFGKLSINYPKGSLSVDVSKQQTFGELVAEKPEGMYVTHSRRSAVKNDVDFFFYGTNFLFAGVELVKDGVVFENDGNEYDIETFSDYNVAGISWYSEEGETDSSERYTVYGGIATSMHREDVEAILGKGHVGTNQEFPTVMYNDGNVTMVIEYFPFEPKYKFEDTPDIIERVQTIYLIRNN